PKSWWRALETISQAVEQAPRLARYKYVRGRGRGIPEGIAESHDVSVNFLTRGSSPTLKGVSSTTAFFNPRIQGWDKVLRTFNPLKAEGWKNAGAALATMTAASIALWDINKDNPEYQSRPLWEKNLFWHIPKPNGGFVLIPKPFEPGLVFASLPERIADLVYHEDPDAFRFAAEDMVRSTFGDLFPVPDVIRPLAEAY